MREASEERVQPQHGHIVLGLRAAVTSPDGPLPGDRLAPHADSQQEGRHGRTCPCAGVQYVGAPGFTGFDSSWGHTHNSRRIATRRGGFPMHRWRAGLWTHPDFLKLWAGQTISLVGTEITRIAFPLTAVV